MMHFPVSFANSLGGDLIERKRGTMVGAIGQLRASYLKPSSTLIFRRFFSCRINTLRIACYG